MKLLGINARIALIMSLSALVVYAACDHKEPHWADYTVPCMDCETGQSKSEGGVCTHEREDNLHKVFCDCWPQSNCASGGTTVNALVRTITGICVSGGCVGTASSAILRPMKIAIGAGCGG